MANDHTIRGRLVDIPNRRVVGACISIQRGRIASIREQAAAEGPFLMPGFVDSHVHVESSMLTPTQFAAAAVVHGTVATVSDPHEIANVLGVEGIHFMLQDAEKTPLKIHFDVPSCVPATPYETSGATLDQHAVAELLDDPRLSYLSEMMNYPGVLGGDVEVTAKINAALDRRKPVDGHAPGLRGDQAAAYVAAGISTDHECVSKDEALDKLAAGCRIQIRQGSAARNFAALYSLIDEYPDQAMLCSDDKHPDDLLAGHMDQLVREAVKMGIDPMNALQAACLNPVRHYGMDVGQLRVGDPADLVEVDNLTQFGVLRTWINGEIVAEQGTTRLTGTDVQPINHFLATNKTAADFLCQATTSSIRVIEAKDGELITGSSQAEAHVVDGAIVSHPAADILKMTVVNRYQDTPPAIGFIRGFGLRQGAIASSVAHDCHNIVSVGVSDDDLRRAVNLVIENRGGLSAVSGHDFAALALPIAGLMSCRSCQEVAREYEQLNALCQSWGTTLRAPFMTLSFMALLVIPELKLSDQGLFDGQRFEFASLRV